MLVKAEEDSQSPFSITDYHEIDWTKRLFQAIQTAYPKLSPKLTMNEALLFRSNGGLAEQWSSCVNGFQHLHFHGAPDLVLKRKIVVVSSKKKKEQKQTPPPPAVMEVANQRPPMVTALGCTLSPEKVGELLAAMITRAACKNYEAHMYETSHHEYLYCTWCLIG